MGILPLCMSVYRVHVVLKEPKEGVGPPGTRVASSHVGAGN